MSYYPHNGDDNNGDLPVWLALLVVGAATIWVAGVHVVKFLEVVP